MNFQQYMAQIERPYWSPVHPRKYVSTGVSQSGKLIRMGWGVVYPDDIGAFNLMWLVSGVGLPPDTYKRYSEQATAVLQVSNYQLGRFSVKECAARMSIAAFADRVMYADLPVFQPIYDALRLRV